mgnify:CR=1 FL=1
MTDREHMPATTTIPGLLCYEDLIESQPAQFEWPALDENTRSHAVLHVRHDRQSEGRAVQPPLDAAARVGRRAARRVRLLGARHDPAGGADVPCQRLGPALRGLHGRREAGVPGTVARRQSRCTSCSKTKRVTLSAGVPTVWKGLLAHVEANGLGFRTMRRTVIGGSACPPAMMRAFQERYDVQVLHAWGMTETQPARHRVLAQAGATARSNPKQRLAVQAKQGRAVFGVDMKIVDDCGNELPQDGKASGELLVRGPWIVSDYFKSAGRRSARSTAGFRPATWRRSMPTASCRSPTAART